MSDPDVELDWPLLAGDLSERQDAPPGHELPYETICADADEKHIEVTPHVRTMKAAILVRKLMALALLYTIECVSRAK
jgi:hypothetical protein